MFSFIETVDISVALFEVLELAEFPSLPGDCGESVCNGEAVCNGVTVCKGEPDD